MSFKIKMIVLLACSISPILIFVFIFFIWTPGLDITDGRNDLGKNGIWIGHGWLGHDSWFEKYHKDKSKFRPTDKIDELAKKLRQIHVTDVFAHLCPSAKTGEIPLVDDAQTERFLDAFNGSRVMPWVGGINRTDAFPDDVNWRRKFTASCVKLLSDHPRFAGIHVNIEPITTGDPNFLLLLEEIRKELPPGKVLSVAPQPPIILSNIEAHWDKEFSEKVAARVDQAAVMTYDTALQFPKLYEQLMNDWTRKVLLWYSPKSVLLGIPCYSEVKAWHDPKTENIETALLGINAGLNNNKPENYQGISIYCEWELDQAEQDYLSQHFLRADQTPLRH